MSGLHGEEEFHKERLKAFCRRWVNPFDQNSNERHIPQPATKFTKEILQIDNLDVTCDNEYTHPPFLCRRCVAKIQRFKKGKNRNQPKFPGDQGKYFVFKTHSENLLSKGTCSICSYSQRQSPRKRLGAVLEESSTVSQEKKAKKQLFESTTSEEAGLSTSSQKTVIDNEPSTETVTLDNIELTGIHLDRFVERDFAQIFQCTVCLDIPTNAVILAGCRHVFCDSCIRQWLAFSSVCPSRRQVTDIEDVVPLKEQMLKVFELLRVECKYSCHGCTEVIKASQLTEHKAQCKFSKNCKTV